GVWLQGSTFSQVTGIAARGNSFIGIEVSGGHNNTVSNCTASHNLEAGIDSDSTLVTITNNTVNSNQDYGIFDSGTLDTIQGNTANSNHQGITLFDALQTTVRANTAEFNT